MPSLFLCLVSVSVVLFHLFENHVLNGFFFFIFHFLKFNVTFPFLSSIFFIMSNSSNSRIYNSCFHDYN